MADEQNVEWVEVRGNIAYKNIQLIIINTQHELQTFIHSLVCYTYVKSY